MNEFQINRLLIDGIRIKNNRTVTSEAELEFYPNKDLTNFFLQEPTQA
jgi:hypothetical protein